MAHVAFIDANQYLGLYGSVTGKKLLEILAAQRDQIFVPRQVADEVLRRKLGLASDFFAMPTETRLASSKRPSAMMPRVHITVGPCHLLTQLNVSGHI
jgi:hypothetical protein